MLLKRSLGAGPVVAVLLAKCRNELKTIRKVDIIGIDELLSSGILSLYILFSSIYHLLIRLVWLLIDTYINSWAKYL